MNPRDAACVMSIVLYTKCGDTQCDKLATIVGQTKLTKLAAVECRGEFFNVQNFQDKVPEGGRPVGLLLLSFECVVSKI